MRVGEGVAGVCLQYMFWGSYFASYNCFFLVDLYILLHYLFHVYIFMYFHCGITASCLYECHPDHHVSSNVSTCIADICQSSKMTNMSDLVRVLF